MTLLSRLQDAPVENRRSIIRNTIEYDTNGGCWLWAGRRNPAGYGKVSRKNLSAHRFSYEAFKGPIGPGLCVCHRCDVTSCVNPEHLFLGTVADNNADKKRKMRDWQPAGGCAHKAKLSDEDAREIYKRVRSGEVQRRIAIEFSVTPQTISNIANGHTFAVATGFPK